MPGDSNALLAIKRRMASLAAHDRFLSIDELENEIPKKGVAYWQNLRGGRKYPARSEVTPRGLGHLLRNTMLIGVIGGGEDYEFRIVGDAPVAALGNSFQGKYLSAMDGLGNMRGDTCMRLYGSVVAGGEPKAFRGCMASNLLMQIPIQCEGVFLPLGPDDGTVNYILGFTVSLSHQF